MRTSIASIFSLPSLPSTGSIFLPVAEAMYQLSLTT